MGLLKHVILPLYALLDLSLVYQGLVSENMDDICEYWGRDTSALPITVLKRHFLHVIGGAALVLFVNNVAAILVENSHYRGMACFLQMLFFAVDGFSYWRMGFDIHPVIFVIVGVGGVGLLIHSREPGIFTKDHDKAKSG